ncbi:MAG: multidrug efflux SMR transporter [SAR324 cluster bacterium]|nr:multidrug efflux SMR transporter [SAR324 cluster bacterium]
MHYFYLALAVLGEVIGTSFLKATEDFTKLWPSLIVVLGYGAAFYFLTLSLKVIPVGIAYATWSGIGIVLVTAISIFLYKQVPDWPAIIGMAMIIGGVVIMQLFSKTVHL